MIAGIINISLEKIKLSESIEVQSGEFLSINDINLKKEKETKGLIFYNYENKKISIVDNDMNILEDVIIAEESIIINNEKEIKEKRKYDKFLFELNKLI
jgi:hypothetical protein